MIVDPVQGVALLWVPLPEPRAVNEPPLLKPPVQDRSKATLERILAAGRELLRERDYDDVTVDDIVRRAKTSKGSFYQRFRDKESLLLFVLREEHREAKQSWSEFLDLELWRERTLAEVLDGLIDRLMEIYRGRSNLMRTYARQVLHVDGETRALAVELNRHVHDRLQAIVAEKRSETDHPDPEQATTYLVTVLVSLLPPLFLSPPELFPVPVSHDALEAELRVMVARYLGTAAK